MSSTSSFLAGLVGGFTKAKDEALHNELAQRAGQRDQMLAYLGHLSSNQDVPAEHRQWALEKMQELIQADPSKKLPKVDLGELPPVSVAQPPRQATPQLPAMTLQPPVGPGGTQPSSQASQPQIQPSSTVGRASDGTVNMTGAASDALAPIPSLQAPLSPMNLPAQSQGVLQNPQPPIEIAPKGQPHILTPADRAKYAQATQQEQLNSLQQRYPQKSPEDLAYFAQHGEFPKAQVHTLAPGAELVDEKGKTLARNEEPKPGAKSGFSYEKGPGGEVMIKDNATGATLSKAEIAANPKAQAVYDTAQAELKASEDRQDERDAKKFANALTLSDKHQEQSLQRQKTSQAVDAAKKAKPMVDLLDTQTEYVNGIANGAEPTPRKDLALVVAAVRAMNPGTVRLPQKELELELHAGSYGDRFKRWADNATEGTLPADQRLDLFHVIRDETTKTATSAAQNWRESFDGTREATPPTYLKRFEKQGKAYTPPSGAPRAVGPNGHEIVVDNGKWVDAQTGEPLQ